MIALRMFQPGSLRRQNGAELGSLKYENSNLSCGVLASYPRCLGCGGWQHSHSFNLLASVAWQDTSESFLLSCTLSPLCVWSQWGNAVFSDMLMVIRAVFLFFNPDFSGSLCLTSSMWPCTACALWRWRAWEPESFCLICHGLLTQDCWCILLMDPMLFYPDCAAVPHHIQSCQYNCWETSWCGQRESLFVMWWQHIPKLCCCLSVPWWSLECQCWCCGVLRELLIDLVGPRDAAERSEMLSWEQRCRVYSFSDRNSPLSWFCFNYPESWCHMLVSEFALLKRRAQHFPLGTHFIQVSSVYKQITLRY